MFVAVGHNGLRLSSRDGIKWTHAQTGREGEIYRAVAFGNGRFAAVGSYGGANIFASTTDGVTWETSTKDGEEGEHINSIVWTGDRFVGVGQGATYFSPDGLKWERKPNSNALLFAVFGDGVFVGSNWRGRILRSTDAIGWKDVFQAEHHVEAIAFGRVTGVVN